MTLSRSNQNVHQISKKQNSRKETIKLNLYKFRQTMITTMCRAGDLLSILRQYP